LSKRALRVSYMSDMAYERFTPENTGGEMNVH